MSTPRRPEVAGRAPTPFSVAFSAGDGPLVATVHGDVDLASAADLQERVLSEVEERAADGVILDFTGVGFMDSTGLRALLEISRHLELRPRPVVLLSPNRSVRKLMALAGLDERVPIAAGLREAEAQLHSDG